MSERELLVCSFCSKNQKQVNQLIAGPGVYICDECIYVCKEIVEEKKYDSQEGIKKLPKPKEIFNFLQEYVIGQETAKKALSVAVYNHYKRVNSSDTQSPLSTEVTKSNIMLLGPTGTGKTHLARTLAKLLDVPFVIADATTLTQTGYSGEDVESILLKLVNSVNKNIAKAERGIIDIDEIDKIAAKNPTNSLCRDIGGEGVQQALLKMIEGSLVTLPVRYNLGGSKSSRDEFLQIDTSKILFIVAGAFAGIEDIVKKRLGIKKPTGFGSDLDSYEEIENIYEKVTNDDLRKFGLIPEFVGRIPVITHVRPLDEKTLCKILVEPKNSLIKQYKELFRLDGIELEFEPEALYAIAKKAISRQTGARGLASIAEEILQPIMFEAPSVVGLEKIIITKQVIEQKAEPKTIFLQDTKDSTETVSENQ